ncbi:MAG: hypothetical protein GW854_01595 [Erythrobacter sp.]|nr:hypothetical protein [Erythrobacter sp.]
MTRMTGTGNNFTREDVALLVSDLVPPVVEAAVERSMDRIQRSLASEIAKGVTTAINEHHLRIGIDSTSPDGISKAHKRNAWIDENMARMPEVERRWTNVDRFMSELDGNDRAWVRESRARAAKDASTLRETVIRWAVPALLGVIASLVGFRILEGKSETPAAPTPVHRETISEQVHPSPTQHPVAAGR